MHAVESGRRDGHVDDQHEQKRVAEGSSVGLGSAVAGPGAADGGLEVGGRHLLVVVLLCRPDSFAIKYASDRTYTEFLALLSSV